MGVPYLVKIRSFTTVNGINTIVYDRKRAVYGLRISPYISVYGHGNIRS
jgi:hypothetical protein